MQKRNKIFFLVAREDFRVLFNFSSLTCRMSETCHYKWSQKTKICGKKDQTISWMRNGTFTQFFNLWFYSTFRCDLVYIGHVTLKRKLKSSLFLNLPHFLPFQKKLCTSLRRSRNHHHTPKFQYRHQIRVSPTSSIMIQIVSLQFGNSERKHQFAKDEVLSLN